MTGSEVDETQLNPGLRRGFIRARSWRIVDFHNRLPIIWPSKIPPQNRAAWPRDEGS
jgi:hypothetical protein